jgi:SAM-dependent methyltransferase
MPGLRIRHRLRRVLGTSPMDDPSTLHDFWRQPAPEGNVSSDYIGPIGRSEALAELIADLRKDARILEVGCNVGRNLAYLADHGWTNVEGVEINEHAVALLRRTFPQLADRPIHVGTAEDVLPTLGGPFDLVFTMAVIEHIHPASAVVFDNMARLGSSVLAIEPRDNVSHRQFPHDVERLFTDRGMRLRSAVPMRQFPGTKDDPGINHFTAWRFDH